MTSPEILDPVLRKYFLKHSLPQIFKALLAGLCISCPDDPLRFIEKKLLAIQESQSLGNDWHSCFDDGEQDTVPSLPQSLVHDIFEDPDDVIPAHVLEKTYSCYRKGLTKMCFAGWRRHIMRKRMKAARLLFMTQAAERHYILRSTGCAFTSWVDWVHLGKHKQADAVRKIQGVWNACMCKIIIAEWRHVVQDSKRTKEYFERLDKDVLDSHGEPTGLPQTDAHDRLSLLPWKLSVKIFKYLGVKDLLKCAQTCHAWNTLAQTCSLWSQLNFSAEKPCITSRTVERILQKYRVFVTYLNISGCVTLQHASFRCISECKNLQELNLNECTNINDEIMWSILEACPSLLSLNLSYTCVTNGTLRVLSRCCLTLQYLSLAYCKNFTDKGLQFLTTGQGCHGLTHLDLSGCTQISVAGFRYIAESCILLQDIKFDDIPTLSDTCVQVLVSKCHSLAVVSVVESPYLSDTAFKAIAEVSSLKKIRIKGNSCLTDSSWKVLCRSSPHLTELHVADCSRMTDTSMKYIGSLKNLSSLNIADFVKLSDAGIRCIADGPSASKLLELNLSNCCLINDLSIMRVAQRCSKLNTLSLCYCENLTDNGFEWLGSCPSLLTLDITGCNIQDQGLRALGANRSLRKLTAAECKWITDTGIEKFCRQVRQLELMDICHCMALSDQSIKVLSFYCRHIVTLKMAGCPKMTDTAVQYLSGACHYIRELDVSSCVHLTDRTPRFLHRGCPQLFSISMLYCRNISRQAALRLQPCVQYWEHSNDDVPCCYGYDRLLPPITTPGKLESH